MKFEHLSLNFLQIGALERGGHVRLAWLISKDHKNTKDLTLATLTLNYFIVYMMIVDK